MAGAKARSPPYRFCGPAKAVPLLQNSCAHASTLPQLGTTRIDQLHFLVQSLNGLNGAIVHDELFFLKQ
jgi:hypothetical protein